jgi:hypothetical protein
MKIKDLFYLLNGVATTDLDISPEQDDFYDTPFLRPSKTALKSIAGYISLQHMDEKYIFKADSLYVSTNGQGSHTFSYVYPVRFSANSDVSILMPKREMALNEKLFYAAIITSNRYKFNYGRKPKGNRLLNLTIPEYKNSIDYQKEKERMIISQPIITDKLNLNISKWEYFELDKLFDMQLGKPIHSIEIKDYEIEPFFENAIPYVTRTKKNNGIDFFVDKYLIDEKKINSENCITIGAEGFEAFFQSKPFINGNKINILRNKQVNKFNALFICSILNCEIEYKFNYGRGVIKERLKKLKIKLPAKNGQPDWQFMENYIKSLPYSKSI